MQYLTSYTNAENLCGYTWYMTTNKVPTLKVVIDKIQTKCQIIGGGIHNNVIC